MRYLFLVILTCAFVAISRADCYEAISQGKDSVHYQVPANETMGINYSLEKSSKVALKNLLEKMGCSENHIHNFLCKQIAKKQKDSLICYARSEVGYFVMNRDYLGNINIVFNRFD